MLLLGTTQLLIHGSLLEFVGNRSLDEDIGVPESYAIDEDYSNSEDDLDYTYTSVEDPDQIYTERMEEENIILRDVGRYMKIVGIFLGIIGLILLLWGSGSDSKHPLIGLILILILFTVSMFFLFFQGYNLGPTDSSIYGDAFHLNQYFDMLTFRFNAYFMGYIHLLFMGLISSYYFIKFIWMPRFSKT